MNTLYVLYDERARQDTDEATVLVACNNIKEAREYKRKDFPNSVIVKYGIKKVNGENHLIDEEILYEE